MIIAWGGSHRVTLPQITQLVIIYLLGHTFTFITNDCGTIYKWNNRVYADAGKNIRIETSPYMTYSTCIWRIPFDLFSDSEKSATLALPNLIFIMQGEITVHVPFRVL